MMVSARARTLDPLIRVSQITLDCQAHFDISPFVPGLNRKGNWKMSKRELVARQMRMHVR